MEDLPAEMIGFIVKFLSPVDRINFGLVAKKYHDAFTVESTKIKKIKEVADDSEALAYATCFAENVFGPEYYTVALRFYLR
jgi:hypothetical protein